MRRTCLILWIVSTACGQAAPAKKDAATVAADVADSVAEDAPPAAPDVPDVAPDTGPAETPDVGLDATLIETPDGCVASCKLADGNPKVCGPNGCGSVCGFCKTGFVCKPDGSACVEVCKPDCSKKKCGDNGCGGSCGACQDKFSCGIDFLCHADDCVGSCTGKACGDDGCGKSCGLCATGDLCADGLCKPGPCKGIPNEGSCAGDIWTHCDGEGFTAKKVATNCSATSPDKTCGWDPVAGSNACIKKPECKPNCKTAEGLTKVCSDDGCGGTCGVCTQGWACKLTYCEPSVGAECGPTWPKAGKCDGDKLQYCNAGNPPKIVEQDCAEAGGTCGWDAKNGKFTCKF